MSTTVITDFTERRVLRPDMTELITWVQEAYRDRQANADKAGDVEEATMYQAEAYAYHDLLTHLTARQCEACGVHEGDDTVVADVLTTCRATKDGKHVWDFPDEEVSA
jgi:hypothetical protein